MSRTWHNGRRQRARKKGTRTCRLVFDSAHVCATGKRCYESQSVANGMLKHIQSERNFCDKVERYAYQCHRCGQWHLTSMDPANRISR